MKHTFIVFLVIFTTAFLNSCQKDIAPPEISSIDQQIENLFDTDFIYTINSNINKVKAIRNRDSKDELIQTILDEMLVKDEKYKFLEKHTKKYGYPIWEYATFIEEGSKVPVVVVPYAKAESKQITTILFVSFIDDNIIFEFAKPNKTKNSFEKLKQGKITWDNVQVSMLSYLLSDFDMFNVYHEDYAEYFNNVGENTHTVVNRNCSHGEVCLYIYVNYAKEKEEIVSRGSGYEWVCKSYYSCGVNSSGDCMECGGEGTPNISGGGSSGPTPGNNYSLPLDDGLSFTQKLDNFATLYDLNSSQKNYLNSNSTLLHTLYESHNVGGSDQQRAQRMFNEQQSYNPAPDLVKISAESAYLKAKNPSWPTWKIQVKAWLNVKLNQVHVALDFIGSIPGYGEPADLLNGIIYVVEGDLWNATISVGASAGIGEIAKYGKYFKIAVKNHDTSIKRVLFAKVSDNGSSIRFVNKQGAEFISEFGARGDLRINIGLKKGDPREAHHLIPWNLRNHPAVQKAAKNVDLPYHLNHPKNGIPLDKFRKNLDNNGVHANHPQYDKEVKKQLDLLNLNDPKLAEKVIALQDRFRKKIVDNPGTKLNDLY